MGPAYFLVVDPAATRHAASGSVRGGGSAAACVAFASASSHRPDRYDLLFERFLNRGAAMPDIDMDFDSRYQEMINTRPSGLRDRGADHHVLHHQGATAVRATPRVLGYPYVVGDRSPS
jgi:DNA polymerase III alpha subunit